MEKLNMPDASNCSITKNFTQIPNDLLKNSNISAKAKVILCILLSNKEGWHSYITQLQKGIKEKKEAIYNGIKELETLGYLKRCHYRSIETKQWKGVFLAYTDIPYEFNITDSINILEANGCELGVMRTKGKAVNGKPLNGFPTTNNTNSNNTNNIPSILPNKDIFDNNTTTKEKLTTILFDKFWNLYPKKANKGDAFTAWNKLCKKPDKEQPSWIQIRKAVNLQIDSEQWQDKQMIPNASTWLNNNKWMNDPNEMILYKRTLDKDAARPPKIYDGIHYNYDPQDGLYKNRAGDAYGY